MQIKTWKLKNKKQIVIWQMFFIIGITCIVLNNIKLLDIDKDIESLVLTGMIGFLCITWIWQAVKNNSERLVLLIGYLFRLLLLFIDIYGREYIVLFSSKADSEGFWRNAVNRYHGIPMPEYTKYPYIIRGFMEVFGENRLMAQYMNIIFWLITAIVLCQCLEIIKVKGNIRLIGIGLFCFMPQYMILTSILMRESMIVFFNTISLYFFLKWYKEQRFLWIVIAEAMVLFSMVLHSGAIGIGAAYGVAYALYNNKTGKMCVSWRTIILLIIGIAGLSILYVSPYRRFLLSYIPKMNSIFEVQKKRFLIGGSDYLRNMPYTTNPWTLVKNSMVRMLYFYISPVPWEWRGIKDIIAFCMDAGFQVAAWTIGIYGWVRKKDKQILISWLLLCLFFTGIIFAWGVSNAGTAMRHRNKLIGIEIVLICAAIKQCRFSQKVTRKG